MPLTMRMLTRPSYDVQAVMCISQRAHRLSGDPGRTSSCDWTRRRTVGELKLRSMAHGLVSSQRYPSAVRRTSVQSSVDLRPILPLQSAVYNFEAWRGFR